MASTLQQTTQAVFLKNNTAREQQLWFEPLGDGITLKPNLLYEITATHQFGNLEIDMLEDGFTVNGWVIKVTAIEQDQQSVVWQLP